MRHKLEVFGLVTFEVLRHQICPPVGESVVHRLLRKG